MNIALCLHGAPHGCADCDDRRLAKISFPLKTGRCDSINRIENTYNWHSAHRWCKHESHSICRICEALHTTTMSRSSEQSKTLPRRNATKIKLKFRVELKSIKRIFRGIYWARTCSRSLARGQWKLMMMNWCEQDIDTGKHVVRLHADWRRDRRTSVAHRRQVCWFLIQLNRTRTGIRRADDVSVGCRTLCFGACGSFWEVEICHLPFATPPTPFPRKFCLYFVRCIYDCVVAAAGRRPASWSLVCRRIFKSFVARILQSIRMPAQRPLKMRKLKQKQQFRWNFASGFNELRPDARPGSALNILQNTRCKWTDAKRTSDELQSHWVLQKANGERLAWVRQLLKSMDRRYFAIYFVAKSANRKIPMNSHSIFVSRARPSMLGIQSTSYLRQNNAKK